MKTFQEFILEAEFTRTVNQKQTFPMDKKTQENLNNARPMGPGRGGPKVRPGVQSPSPVRFSIVPANIPMK